MPEALNKLAGLLQDWFAKDGNSPNKLEGLLVEYGGGLGKIDRRKLGALARGEDAALSFAQMKALEAFLTKEYRQTFASLFEPSALMPSLLLEVWQSINKVSGTVKLDFEDVLCTDSANAAPSTWSSELMGRGTRKSMVSIGSQRANPATELMLASMFGVVNAQDPASSMLPFHFVWDQPSKRPSAFSKDVSKIPQSLMKHPRVKRR